MIKMGEINQLLDADREQVRLLIDLLLKENS
jgi:hypothetical protein